jgi:hypothetical protein
MRDKDVERIVTPPRTCGRSGESVVKAMKLQ